MPGRQDSQDRNSHGTGRTFISIQTVLWQDQMRKDRDSRSLDLRPIHLPLLAGSNRYIISPETFSSQQKPFRPIVVSLCYMYLQNRTILCLAKRSLTLSRLTMGRSIRCIARLSKFWPDCNLASDTANTNRSDIVPTTYGGLGTSSGMVISRA